MKIRQISLLSVIGALYAALVIVFVPISYGPIQLRIADCLIPLSAIFGWPAILGVSMGALISNAYYWLGPADVVLGTLANLVSAATIYYLRRSLFTACLLGAILVGVIVGGYLWIYFPPPDFPVSLPVWGSMMVSISLSSLITISLFGYLLVKAIKSSGFLKEWG